jgi:zinc/manganese transport system substrate-binding protein
MPTKIFKLITFFILIGTWNVGFAKIKIVTSTEDIASVVEELVGNNAEIDFVAKGSADAHFIEAKPSFMIKLSNADLLISNGLALEEGWLPNLISGARNRKLTDLNLGHLELGKFVNPLMVPTSKVSRAEGDVHPEGNPHFTLDPIIMLELADKITERLITLDESNKNNYQVLNKKFKTTLNSKIQNWQSRLSKVSEKKIITYHGSLLYFLTRFGFSSAGYIEPKPGIPPSAKHLKDLVDLIKSQNIKLVLVQSFFETSFVNNFKQAGLDVKVMKVGIARNAMPGLKTYFDVIENLVMALENPTH